MITQARAWHHWRFLSKAGQRKRQPASASNFAEAVAAGGGGREEEPAPNELSNHVKTDRRFSAPLADFRICFTCHVRLRLQMDEFTGMTGLHHQG